MRCSHCGWNNPAGFGACYQCKQPLVTGADNARVSHASGEVFASIGARAMATLVDLSLFALTVPLWLWSGMYLAQNTGVAGPALFVLLAAGALLVALLPALLDSYGKGSIGKRLLGIRVVDHEGGAPGLLRSILRTLAKYVLHPLLSLPVLLVERLLFGEHSLHNLLTHCHVVSAHASDEAIRYRLRNDPGSARFRRAARWFAYLLGGAILLAAALLTYAAWTATPNPRRDAVRATATAAKEIARAIGRDWAANQRFPERWNGMLPPSIAKLGIDASSGVLTVTPSDPLLAGAHLVLVPEIARTKNEARIRSWRCGSPDLARSDLPFGCNSDTKEPAIESPKPETPNP